MVPPAASTAALTFSHIWRVCASMSPTPATDPSARLLVMPEMNTRRPPALAAMAWEKCPLGRPMRGDVICWRIRNLSRAVRGREPAPWRLSPGVAARLVGYVHQHQFGVLGCGDRQFRFVRDRRAIARADRDTIHGDRA